MKDDLISRRYLIEAFKEEFYYMYSDNFKFMLNWFKNLPAVDSFKFCDQLWKIAYEHGKRDARPATEPMTGLYVVGFNDGYEAGKEDAQQNIVHCKDCKHWDVEWIPAVGEGHYCPMIDHVMVGDEWCCYGERRTDG